MRRGRLVSFLVVPLLLATACGGGDDEEPLTKEEQRYANAFARDLSDGDDGLSVTVEEAACIGDAILHVLGVRPFHEAGIEPADLEGDETPGQLLGEGTVSDDQADEIAGRWLDCVDLVEDLVAQAKGSVELDDEGQACFEDALRDGTLPHDYLVVSFTSDDPADVNGILGEMGSILGRCRGAGGTATTASPDESTSERLARLLVDRYAEDPDDARCLADGIISRVSADDLQAMVTAGGPGGPSDAARARVAVAMQASAAACGLQLPEATTTTDAS